MKNMDWNTVHSNVNKLFHDAYTLVESSLANVNDWCRMRRFQEKLVYFQEQMLLYVNFNHLIFSMQNEKDRFLVEKAAKYHTERFKQSITTFIEISRSWKMHDYRCQNFQKQAETFFLDLQNSIFE